MVSDRDSAVVVFRCTRKLLAWLKEPIQSAAAPATALLGDWDVTLVFTRRRIGC